MPIPVAPYFHECLSKIGLGQGGFLIHHRPSPNPPWIEAKFLFESVKSVADKHGIGNAAKRISQKRHAVERKIAAQSFGINGNPAVRPPKNVLVMQVPMQEALRRGLRKKLAQELAPLWPHFCQL